MTRHGANSASALRKISQPDPATRSIWETPPKALSPRRTRLRAILEYLVGEHWLPERTDRQIMEGLGLPDMNCVRPRINEGIREKLLTEAGDVVCPVTRMPVRTVRITQAGLNALRQIDDREDPREDKEVRNG